MAISTRSRRAAGALLFAGVLGLGTLAAAADTQPPARREPPPGVFGEWWFEPMAGPGIVQVFSLHLAPDRMTMTNHCRSGNRTVTARASAPARVGGGRIEPLHGAEDEQSWRPGILVCRIAVQPGTVHYEVAGDRLILRDPKSGRTLEATRSRP